MKTSSVWLHFPFLETRFENITMAIIGIYAIWMAIDTDLNDVPWKRRGMGQASGCLHVGPCRAAGPSERM